MKSSVRSAKGSQRAQNFLSDVIPGDTVSPRVKNYQKFPLKVQAVPEAAWRSFRSGLATNKMSKPQHCIAVEKNQKQTIQLYAEFISIYFSQSEMENPVDSK